MATKARKKASARPVSKLDLTKPVKVGAAAKPRSKGEVFSTTAQHVGMHRRDVAAVFHVMGALIKADLSMSGSGVFQEAGLTKRYQSKGGACRRGVDEGRRIGGLPH